MKPADVKSTFYAEYKVDSNEKDPKLKIGDNVRVSKYKNIFAKGYTPNWSEEVFVIKKVKNAVPWTYVIMDLNGEEVTGVFTKNFLSDLSSYATKLVWKNVTGVDTSKLAAKSDLAILKAEVDKIDIEKLKTVLVDLSKLSNVVNDELVKKNVYDKLVAKVNNIDTSGFVLKTKYNANKSDLEKKISDPDKKFLILVDLLKRQIIVLKLVK